MRRLILSFALILAFIAAIGTAAAPEIVKAVPDARYTNPIFNEGEELVYKVYWMGLLAGYITITVDDIGQYRLIPAHRGTVLARTAKGFSSFFKVDDKITTYFAKDTFNSIHYIKDIREGKYRKYRETEYDQAKKTASTPSESFEILPDAKDPIACIYALRRERLRLGISVKMNANSEGKDFPITIKVDGIEEVNTPIGPKKAFRCLPLPTWEGRVFEKNRSKVELWISDDDYQVPIKIFTKVKFGKVKAYLHSRTGPGWQIRGEL